MEFPPAKLLFVLGLLNYAVPSLGVESPPAPLNTQCHYEQFSCRILKPTRAMEGSDTIVHYNKERLPEQCYNALPLPAGLKDLPSHFAPVGKEKSHFVIPITKNPEQHLEPGDILVYFRDVDPDSTKLYEHLTKGRWHAAVVGMNGKQLYHLDSPTNLGGVNFTSSLYHVLRLRPDLPNRAAVLKSVLDNTRVMKAHFDSSKTNVYDPERITEATIPKNIPELRAYFKNGQCPPYRYYCSEVALTLLVAAGLEPMKPQSILVDLDRIENKVLPRLLAKTIDTKGASVAEVEIAKQKLISDSIQDFFNDARMLQELGATQAELIEFSNSGRLPQMIEEAKSELSRVLSTPAHLRPALLLAIAAKNQGKGTVIGPSDLMDNICQKDGVLSYAFTYVGETWKPRTARPSQTQADLGDRTSAVESLRAQPGHLWDHRVHSSEILDWTLSADGVYVLTGSRDRTAAVLNLRTRTTQTISHDGEVSRVAFSPNSKFVLTGTGRALKLTLVGKDKAIAFPGCSEGEFSPTGRYVLVSKKIPPPEGILGGMEFDTRAYLLYDTTRFEQEGYTGILLKFEFPMAQHRFSPDDRWLFASARMLGGDGTLGGALLDPATGKVLKKFANNKTAVMDAKGKYLFHTTPGDGVTRYELDALDKRPLKITFQEPFTFPLPISATHVLNLGSTDQKKLYLHDYSGKITEIDSMSSKAPTLPESTVDGRVLVIKGDRGTLIHHVDTGQQIRLENEYTALNFLPRDRIVAQRVDRDRAPEAPSFLIELSTGKERRFPSTLNIFSDDGRFAIATSDSESRTEVFNLETGTKEFDFKVNSGSQGHQFFLDPDFVLQPDESDITIFSRYPVDLDLLRKKLREYDAENFIGSAGEIEKQVRQIILKFVLEKLRASGFDRDAALREMSSIVTHATYRGDLHVLGVLNELFPQ